MTESNEQGLAREIIVGSKEYYDDILANRPVLPKEFFKEVLELKDKMRELMTKYGITEGFSMVLWEGKVCDKYDVGKLDCSNDERSF
jgi:hypothetical protein